MEKKDILCVGICSCLCGFGGVCVHMFGNQKSISVTFFSYVGDVCEYVGTCAYRGQCLVSYLLRWGLLLNPSSSIRLGWPTSFKNDFLCPARLGYTRVLRIWTQGLMFAKHLTH